MNLRVHNLYIKDKDSSAEYDIDVNDKYAPIIVELDATNVQLKDDSKELKIFFDFIEPIGDCYSNELEIK